MMDLKNEGANLNTMKLAIENAGYPVTEVDTKNSQLYVSCCAGPDGQWKVAAVADFPSVCPWGNAPVPSPPPRPSPSPSPSPGPSANKCVPSAHGPACSSDADCADVPDCLRCAGSGYCTMQPLEVAITADESKSTCSNKGHCGLAYQTCCLGFQADGFGCTCSLADGGTGVANGQCGDCGAAYTLCCAAYGATGNACTCDVNQDGVLV